MTGGRPGPRRRWPSYFRAINCRCGRVRQNPRRPSVAGLVSGRARHERRRQDQRVDRAQGTDRSEEGPPDRVRMLREMRSIQSLGACGARESAPGTRSSCASSSARTRRKRVKRKSTYRRLTKCRCPVSGGRGDRQQRAGLAELARRSSDPEFRSPQVQSAEWTGRHRAAVPRRMGGVQETRPHVPRRRRLFQHGHAVHDRDRSRRSRKGRGACRRCQRTLVLRSDARKAVR